MDMKRSQCLLLTKMAGGRKIEAVINFLKLSLFKSVLVLCK